MSDHVFISLKHALFFFFVLWVLQADPCGARESRHPQVFASPQAAVTALLEACKHNDTAGLMEIFGSAGREFISTGDPERDREQRARFYRASGEWQKLDKRDKGGMVLYVGRDAWPFPVPLVRAASGWCFDAAAGKNELVNRKVGENELQAIAACQAYVAAQKKYYSRDRDGDRQKEYALRLWSTEGSKDGLYWPADPESGEELSPLGPLVAEAQLYLEGVKTGIPPYGYYFRILTKQGFSSTGGARNYIRDGKMVGGFGLVAWPARYGSSGIMSFIVNQSGEVYEKNLGPVTNETARSMSEFNPDRTWTPVRLWLAGKKPSRREQ